MDFLKEKPRKVPRPPPHAVRSIARGAGPRSEGRCAPCAGPHGHTTWLGVGRPWFDGGSVVPSRRALAHLSRRRRAAIRRLDGRRPLVRRRGLRLCAPCAHPLARRPRWWWRVSTQSACPIAQPCTAVDRERRRITRLGRSMRQRALVCSLCDAVARRVGVRGKAADARCGASWGRMGGAMCMPRGRGRRPRAVARS